MEKLKEIAGEHTYTVNEKCPQWFYNILEEKDCDFMVAKRDYKSWQVVIPLKWFKEKLKVKEYRCPYCGEKIDPVSLIG